MNWIDSLERRFGRFAIPGLPRIVVALNALVFLLQLMNPYITGHLTLDLNRVMQGEIWRLFTFLFIPHTHNLILIFFVLSFLWWIGDGLERAWGSFRLTLFYAIGCFGSILAACFFGGYYANFALNSSLFFAFAYFYPDAMFYVLFILPVKVKWAAWVSAAFLLLQFLTGPVSFQMAIVAAYSNYLLFFGPELIHAAKNRRRVAARREQFARTSVPKDQPLYTCAVCHRTDRTNPELEFRVGRDGNDYCLEHLPKQ